MHLNRLKQRGGLCGCGTGQTTKVRGSEGISLGRREGSGVDVRLQGLENRDESMNVVDPHTHLVGIE